MNKLWEKFDDLSSECYTNMIQSKTDKSVWYEAFSILVEIVKDGRNRDVNFASELYLLEESIDFRCDVSGWLEDYLDELDMYQQYDKLREDCKTLLDLFQWKEDSPSDLYFRIASSLRAQGKNTEALAFCEDWYKKEQDNILAATALIYARTAVKDFAGAEQIVTGYISEEMSCTEDNDIIYTAAALLYKVSGNKKAEKWVNRAIEKYEQELEEYFAGAEDLEFDILDEDLPFN